MRIIFHLGAHCTDEDRLLRCLLKNQGLLLQHGILVPPPSKYRRLLRDTAIELKGRPASLETQSAVLENMIDDDLPKRLVLSWDSFLSFPQWSLQGALYNYAGDRSRVFRQIFPNFESEFFLAIRNPATFVPAIVEKNKDKTYAELTDGVDLYSLSWLEVVRKIHEQNPDTPITVWCDEDMPFISTQVLQKISGHDDTITLAESDELLSTLLTPDGFKRMRSYLEQHPPTSQTQRHHIISAFLEKFARPDQVEMSIDLPGWDEKLIDDLTHNYFHDIENIKKIPNVTFLSN